MQLILLIFSINIVNTALPRIPLCEPVLHVAWRRHEPYLTLDTWNVSGVVPTVFQTALRSCCRGEIVLNYTIEFKTQEDVVDVISNYTVDFVMPIQKDIRSGKYLSYPYLPIVESPGVAFYVTPSPSAGEAIIEAITSTWPLIVIMFIMVAVAGTFFWILEMVCSREEERKPLIVGVTEGIWWAFVSMTTVGYGDICPMTKPGKIFSICWVMTGVACCALFTAYVTTILTSSCLAEDTSLFGTKVGVLRGGEVHSMAIKKNAVPIGFESVPQILHALDKEAIDAALVDSYVAAEYQSRFDNFRLQDIIEHVTSNGVVFQNNGVKYWQCIHEYLLSRQDIIIKMVQSSIHPLRTSHSQSRAEEKSRNLLDPTSASFYIPVTVILVGLAGLFIFGMLWDKIKQRKKSQESDALLDNHEMTLTQWRKSYMTELHDVVKAIHGDATNLKQKCQSICDKLERSSYGLVAKISTQ